MADKGVKQARLTEQVWQALGGNRVEQRWVADKHGVEGLAFGHTIIVSPLPLVPVIIHEALHRAHPRWSEDTVQRHTTYLYSRMSDDECHRLYDAYAAKVVYISKPISAE
ncbi:MAG: hypothetical protein NTY02_09345 [Acidobacteria bacterium]|nr:hypothetical protein [Acidobacteriota bacterium]